MLEEMDHMNSLISSLKRSIRNLEAQNLELESKNILVSKHRDELLGMNKEYEVRIDFLERRNDQLGSEL